MARPRKALKFANVLGSLSVPDLKILKNEVAIELRLKERAVQRTLKEQDASKLRNKIKIGQTISFKQSSPTNKVVEATVLGIFANKVQVEVNNRKRSVALSRVLSIE